MNENELVTLIRNDLEIELPVKIAGEELRSKLSAHIHHLIVHDFQKLVSVLYRIDVNEGKLKQLLKEKPGEDAGFVIADLIIERQIQKIKSRKETKGNNNIPEDDKW
ncbi:MAG: hypothetical protein WDO71_09825 [Bacteroidota bacterium]